MISCDPAIVYSALDMNRPVVPIALSCFLLAACSPNHFRTYAYRGVSPDVTRWTLDRMDRWRGSARATWSSVMSGEPTSEGARMWIT